MRTASSTFLALLVAGPAATVLNAQGPDFAVSDFYGLEFGSAALGADGAETALNPGSFTDDAVIRHTIVADNGLTFSAEIDLGNRPAEAEQAPPPDWQISLDSFDMADVPDQPRLGAGATFPNTVVTQGAGWGACGTPGGSRSTYFTPRFAGFQLGVNYTSDLDDRRRGAMATEPVLGVLVNPALNFDYRLDGITYDLGAGFCLDTGRLLPTTFSLGLSGAALDGSDGIGGLAFPNLGITGLGGTPGVLINSPTDVTAGSLDADYHLHDFSVDFVHPIRINPSTGAREELVATPSGSFWQPLSDGPSFGTLNLLGGLRYGTIDQDETLRILADTPAFGANSAWQTQYDTAFSADRFGAYLGLSTTRSYGGRNGATNSFGLAATIGYDHYDISVRDRVVGTGFGGLLNFTDASRISRDDGIVTGSLRTAYSWSRDNTSVTVGAGLDWNSIPGFNYHRPDSTGGGVPLPPTVGLEETVTLSLGAGLRVSF